MAADLRGDLLGATVDLNAAQVRWLSPLPLWTGILAGPIAWAVDLTVSYALVKAACVRGNPRLLVLVTLVSLLAIAGGAVVSWNSLACTRGRVPTDGGRPIERARFMAIVGLASCAFFTLATLALDMPRWVLDACR
jgi:hypothetical protein